MLMVNRKALARSARIRGFAAFATICVIGACVSPQDDLDDYLTRTKDLRVRDAGPPQDVSLDAPAGSFAGTYYVECLSVIPRLDSTLRFAGDVRYTANGPTSGTYDMGIVALAIGSTTVSGRVGNGVFLSGVPVSEGQFTAQFAEPVPIPQPANALTRVDGTVRDAKFYGVFTNPPARFCANLSGTTTPSGLRLTVDNTHCLFDRLESDASTFPVHALEDFHCP